jgi:hypothetical protein
MKEDGSVELIGVCMDVNRPETQEQREISEKSEDSLEKPLQ